jgi:hypothetical protein
MYRAFAGFFKYTFLNALNTENTKPNAMSRHTNATSITKISSVYEYFLKQFN